MNRLTTTSLHPDRDDDRRRGAGAPQRRRLLRRHRRPVGRLQPRPPDPCAGYHAHLRIRHHRHQARRAAACRSATASSARPRSPPSPCRRCSATGCRAVASPSASSAARRSTASPTSTPPSSATTPIRRCGCPAAAARRRSPSIAARSSSPWRCRSAASSTGSPFVTSLGHGTGRGSREALGVKTKGPTRLITDLCVLEPDAETREMTVVSIHPSVERDRASGELRLAAALRRPDRARRRRRTDNELGVLRELHARTRRAHGGEDA